MKNGPSGPSDNSDEENGQKHDHGANHEDVSETDEWEAMGLVSSEECGKYGIGKLRGVGKYGLGEQLTSCMPKSKAGKDHTASVYGTQRRESRYFS